VNTPALYLIILSDFELLPDDGRYRPKHVAMLN